MVRVHPELYNFAFALDDEIVALFSVDPNRYPEGIDPSDGAQIWGVESEEDAERVATVLKLGELPDSLRIVAVRGTP